MVIIVRPAMSSPAATLISYFLVVIIPKIILASLKGNEQVLIVLSFDGLRPEDVTETKTPNLFKLMKYSTFARRLKPIFPTKTFPNHFTFVTGLYADKHGVVDNSFYDPKLKEEIKYSAEMFYHKEDVKPIWILNEMNGGTSGCMQWSGSNFLFKEKGCTFMAEYKKESNLNEMVDKAISWLRDPVDPVNLIMMYVENPDKIGHVYGSRSSQYLEQLKNVDKMAWYLHKSLRSKCVNHRTNIVHVSDHGMIDITQDKIVDITTFLAPEGNYEIYGSSPVLQIVPENGKQSEVLNALKSAEGEKFKVYDESSLPEHWHIKNPRFGPIAAVANLGYAFQDLNKKIESYKKKYKINVSNSSKFGMHGYDNEKKEMSGFFMARGPFFRKNTIVDQVNAIDLFAMFCHILDIKEVPEHDGSLSNFDQILNGRNMKVIIWSLVAIAVMATFVIVATVVFVIFEKRKSYLIWT